MFKITINNDLYYCPSSWNELSRNQLLDICYLAQQNCTPNEFKTKLLLSVLGLKTLQVQERTLDGELCFFFRIGRKTIYILSAIDIACLIDRFDFLFVSKKDADGNIQFQFNSRLTKNLITSFKLNGQEFFGPADSLTNILFHEYIFAETYLVEYSKTQIDKYLDMLIAVLWREQDPKYNPEDISFNGDRRKPFNDFQVEARAKAISKLDKATKQAILFFYDGCRNYLRVKFKEVFEGAGSGENIDAFSGFMKLVTALTNNDITKNEHVRKSYMYEVMISLQEMKTQADAMQKQMEKLKKK
jgi:hypothetical protein